MAGTSHNTLPWEYRDSPGYDGLPIDMDLAKSIVLAVGVESQNKLGDTPLSTAAMLGRVEMVVWLLDRGAAVDRVAPGGCGRTPLMWACEQKRLPVVKVLVDAGASLEAADDWGNTPLANAFINCFADPFPIAEFLIARGAKITPRVSALGSERDESRFAALLGSQRPGPAAEPLSWPTGQKSTKDRGRPE
jgi:ankyrin repeat protein